ncbi:protein STRUBBELIG-RECEPTOR FAMILY 6 isoform X1 [Canna indica]|uniref:Protein STRUBBELIG-RECEPTOR FAMILY 6 isoform X1 n=1 Tax=Canna indica TaxID=4628 RepID=A0AAQ3KUI6_9LILI|nr:protein STRUBBELIG-RECEPTOR FAMILY 6 isoform X1 [Canna indica]
MYAHHMQERGKLEASALLIRGRMGRMRGRGRGMLAIWLLLACACAWHPGSVNGASATDSNDVSALNVLFSAFNSDAKLTGWKQSGGDPCGESWRGVTCSNSAVTAIKLSGLSLTGTIGYNLNIMSSLTELDLSNNNLGNGAQIPYNLPTSLQRLDLSNNQFGQDVPYVISQMTKLEYLNIAHNRLQGSIGDMFGSLSNLATIDLSFNSLSGDLPQSFSSLTSLTNLYLQNNQLTGHIDVFANLPLQDLNVENNRFTGWIPNQLKGIKNIRTGNNQWSSGPAPPPPPYAPPPPGRKSNPGQNSGGGGGGIGGGGIAGIIISIFIIGGIIAFFVIRRKSRKHTTEEILEQDRPFAHLASDEVRVAEMKRMQTSSIIDTEKLPPPPAPISLKPPPVDHYKSFDEDDSSNKPIPKKGRTTSVKATSYSVADLQIATDSFSEDNLLGEGSFGRVYKAQFSDGKVFAVKKLNSTALTSRSSDDFIEFVINISRLHHPNLTELVGYCSEHGQRLLVYDFHNNGSLCDLLQLSEEPLAWNTRVKIALGTARALEYLHEVCSPSVVHRNLKSSNILLDTEFNPHLSDCGLESLVPNAQAYELNMGYNAPEVAMSGQYNLKSDVYGFGVVMLELMTGRKPFDSSRPRSEQSLVQWATPQLHDIDALERMVDPALKGLYPSKSLSRFADIIALCVQSEPEFRPPMSEVVQDLVRLVKRERGQR